MPICSLGGHRCAQLTHAAYVALPGDQKFTSVRWRWRNCHRHGRQLLTLLYKAGVDAAAEGDDPEYCIHCGNPGAATPLEVSVYEGETRFTFLVVACEGCDPSTPQIVVEPLVGAEKLPPRENRSNGPSRKPR